MEIKIFIALFLILIYSVDKDIAQTRHHFRMTHMVHVYHADNLF